MSTTVTTVALTGLGGVGKTQIAIEAAYRAREKRPQLSICWISASSAETIEQGWLGLCKTLEIPLDKCTRARELVCRKLEEEGFGPWLLIIDNMDDMDTWASEKSWLPTNGNGLMLLTTRNRKIAVNAASSRVYNIPALDLSEAETLLSHRIFDPKPVDYDWCSVRQLVTKLNCLPLAITQAATYINSNGVTVAEYLSSLSGSEQSLMETLSESFPDEGRYAGQANAIASTWTISFKKIQNVDSLAGQYMSIMSCLYTQGIPLSILPASKSKKALMDAIGTLSAYSFVNYTYLPTSNLGTTIPGLTIHPLVHAAMRNWLREAKALTRSTVKAIQHIDTIFPEHDDHMRQSQLFGSWRCYLPHVDYLMRTTTDNISIERVDLLEKYGLCLYTDGRYRDAEEPLHTILQIRTKLFGQQDARTLNSMNNLALVYSNQSKLSTAETLQGRACKYSKEALGHDHPCYINGINTLSTIYQRQARWDDAEVLGKKIVEYRQSHLGLENPTTLNSMESLAYTYTEQERWKEAEDIFRHVFDLRRWRQGDRDQSVLRSMNNLAHISINHEDWERAIELYRQAVHLAEEVLGPKHSDTISYSCNLGYAYQANGMLLEAEEICTRSLELSKEVLGDNHITTFSSMANLASVRNELGYELHSLDLMEDCVQRCRKVLGINHPITKTYSQMLDEWEMAKDGFDACVLDGEFPV
ncbi:kinesin light chain 1 [Penicillium cataractarum]|uniref:Kinesin light chain 1 n=1 Tax=Penicillium cataractarum TaxID=2100454 RepID=A0A9W9VFQ3_9EURO|nr:kinesin light chain 1 [Penicillium cataractarum]KAJ5377815.1 kinesin light chain 1 [Penicillium cataractarum]